jgi:hypothetical protein
MTADSLMAAKPGLAVLGDWDGADAILAPARSEVQKAARAVLLALVEATEAESA